MSRKPSDRKYYIKKRLIDSGFDESKLIDLSLEELEELYRDYMIEKKEQKRLAGEKKEQKINVEKAEPTYTIDDVYKALEGKDEETLKKQKWADNQFDSMMHKIRNGYLPDPLEIAQFSPQQQIKLMREIPYQGISPLIYGRSRKKKEKSRAIKIW